MSPVGGTALSRTTILGNGVLYYASQTNCIESSGRLDVTVKISVNSFNCGLSALMIKHTSAGGVAPIDQTISYQTGTDRHLRFFIREPR